MDPELGRFITEDSVDDPNNPNLYVYVANNPLTNVDPTGHWNEDSRWWNPFTWFNGSGGSNTNNTNTGGSSTTPTPTPNPTAPAPGATSNTTTQGNVTVDINQVVVKDNAGNVVGTYNRDEMKNDLQKLAQLQQNAYNTKSPADVKAATEFADTVKNKYKDFFNATKDSQGGVSVIGLRGFGVGTPCIDTPKIKGEKNTYNDMLIVMGTDGALDVLSRCNFEGTTATGTYGDKTLNAKGYPSIANGIYDLQSNSHLGKYNDVILTSNGSYKIPTIGQNPQYPERGNPGYATGIEIHKGGIDWTYSQGCITIYAPSNDTSRWDRFISHFPTQPVGTRVGSFNLMTL